MAGARTLQQMLTTSISSSPGKKWRLKAASVAKELKPSAVQGWTVLVPTPSCPLCTSADCCLIYQNGKIISSPPLSTLKSATERRKRKLDVSSESEECGFSFSFPTWVKYPHPPGLYWAFLFYRIYHNQLATSLWSPPPPLAISLTQQTDFTDWKSIFLHGGMKYTKKEEKQKAG